jgi:FkbM family methyltransferase
VSATVADRERGRSVARFRFDIALRNRMDSRSLETNTMFDRAPVDRPPSKDLRTFVRRIRHRIRHKVQRVLFGPLHERIAALHGRLDSVATDTQVKLDGLQRQTVSVSEDLKKQLSADVARIASELNALQRALSFLSEQVADLGLRVRSPLELGDGDVAIRTFDGFVVVPRSDLTLLVMLHDAGPSGLEPGTRRVITRILAAGSTFVDVGAHVGILSLAAARAVQPNGRILALEPASRTFESLRKTVLANDVQGTVEAMQLACGQRQEKRELYVGRILGHSSLRPPDKNAQVTQVESVEVRCLDDLVGPRHKVDLVKIDVEGFELDVLAGMRRVISDNHDIALIVEFAPSHLRAADVSVDEWMMRFSELGFVGFAIDELSGECEAINMDEISQVRSANLLFARRDSNALKRLGL